MRITILAALALIPLLQGTQNPHGQQPPTFSVGVDLIKVPVTVLNHSGSSVGDLHAAGFRIHEDGVPQEIRSFGMDRNPVAVVLVLDTSATVKAELNKIKDTASRFAEALEKEDRVSVITFDDTVNRVLDWTSDKRLVRKALRKVQPGLRTALYDGLTRAAMEQLAGIEGRRAIILLTDCLNNMSSASLSDAVLAVVQAQATLYVVSKTQIVREEARRQRRVVMLTNIYRRLFGDDNYVEEFFKKRESEMIDLAERTGGRCYFPANYDEIPQAYEQVARELKNQHYLTYISNQPKRPNSYHEIKVEYLQAESRVIHRRGYYFEPRKIHLAPR